MASDLSTGLDANERQPMAVPRRAAAGTPLASGCRLHPVGEAALAG